MSILNELHDEVIKEILVLKIEYWWSILGSLCETCIFMCKISELREQDFYKENPNTDIEHVHKINYLMLNIFLYELNKEIISV